MNYLFIKLIHVVSSTLLFGGGVSAAILGSLVFRSGKVNLIVDQGAALVKFDWYITLPTAFIQCATGLWMASKLGLSALSGWIGAALTLFGIVVACWLPGIWLQHRMVALANESMKKAEALPDSYFRLLGIWTLLGLPSTVAMLGIFYLMVFRTI